jgi:hypothetical protein
MVYKKRILSFYYYQDNTLIAAKWMPANIFGGKKEQGCLKH